MAWLQVIELTKSGVLPGTNLPLVAFGIAAKKPLTRCKNILNSLVNKPTIKYDVVSFQAIGYCARNATIRRFVWWALDSVGATNP